MFNHGFMLLFMKKTWAVNIQMYNVQLIVQLKTVQRPYSVLTKTTVYMLCRTEEADRSQTLHWKEREVGELWPSL